MTGDSCGQRRKVPGPLEVLGVPADRPLCARTRAESGVRGRFGAQPVLSRGRFVGGS